MKISNEIFIFTHTIYYTNDILFTYLYSWDLTLYQIEMGISQETSDGAIALQNA